MAKGATGALIGFSRAEGNARLIVIALLAAGLMAWFFTRGAEPAFDLDGFDAKMSRLRAAYELARRTADTDTVSEEVLEDKKYLGRLGRLLSSGGDDCQADAEAVMDLWKDYRKHLEKIPGLPDYGAGGDSGMGSGIGKVRMIRSRYEQQVADVARHRAERAAIASRARREMEARRLVALLAPAWLELAPAVRRWARACPEESEILYDVLGVKRPADR
ncbi:MAG: hypothetical protein D6806_18815 [Deltaproteobacteria bacterium]|nr:MAG: hypothetical protein D6806_18815 [Deltaproteobacteria bacterium]